MENTKVIFKSSFRYLLLTFIITFGIMTIVASGGGGGDDNGDGGSAPVISNLSYFPTSADIGSGEGQVPVTYSFEFIDNDGNISTATLSVFDSNNNLLYTSDDPVEGISGIKSGIIEGGVYADTTVAGEFTFEIYMNDKTNLKSNVLTGDFLVTDPAWRTKASMPEGRSYMGVASVNGKIYVLGGQDAGGVALNTLEYDPSIDTWTTKSPMPSPENFLAPFVANTVNGKIHVISQGLNSTTILNEYDPLTDTWAIISTMSAMPTERYAFAIVEVNGKIYAIGGTTAGNTEYLDTVEEYDLNLDTWETKASMPTARSQLAVAVVNGKIYAIGGYNGINSTSAVEEYDPVADTWNTKSSMSTSNSVLSAAAINDKIYAIGGMPSGDVEEYDTLTDKWTTKSSMPTARYGLALGVENGKIYAIGGVLGPSVPFSTVEEYDPSKDQ